MSLQALSNLELSGYPLSRQILTELGGQMPFLLKSVLDESQGVTFQDRLPALEFVAKRLSLMLDDGSTSWVEHAVRSYVILSIEFLKLQRQLEQTGRYLLSSEREAQEHVYHNEGVFGFYYLYGLLVSEVLWPNHYKLNAAYQDHFLPLLSDKYKILEVGVGTGYHLYHLFNKYPGLSYLGVDLSDYAIEFAQKFAFGETSRQKSQVAFLKQNVTEGLNVPDDSYDGIIFGEVLEHVEEPDRLLVELRRVLRPSGHMFMTTVVFAANIDHIYLFEKADDIRRMLDDCGWIIDEEWVLPIYPQDSPEMEKRPMNYGAILSKQVENSYEQSAHR